MLEQITWSNYLLAMASATLAYYLLIGLIYYRSELGVLISKLNRPRVYGEETEVPSLADVKTGTDNLQHIVSRINRSLEQAGTDIGKEELLNRIGTILAGYEDLDRPAFKVALKHHIIEQAKELCGVGFSEGELEEALGNLPR